MHRYHRSTRSLTASTALSRLLIGLAAALGAASMAQAQAAPALPTGGIVTTGQATISSNAANMTINQSTANAVINWQGFSVGPNNSVQFVQPTAQSVTLNRVTGSDPSSIFGTISANGQVFLVNPNGVLFGRGAQVNVGGLVASTLGLSDADFMAGHYKFSGQSNAVVLNQGAIHADRGYVALLGANVSSQGLIQANLGTVALAAGKAITLDIAGDGLLNVAIDEGTANALVANGGILRANGGSVVMTTQAAGQMFKTAVNNSGVIEAKSLDNRSGQIRLLGDMREGTVSVAGTLDASAPAGGNGGFIETSAASVKVPSGVRITTDAPLGTKGTWLVDPKDFNIATTGGDISGATLSAQLVTTNVTISTIPSANDGTAGAGDINVQDAVSWTASGTSTTLTLNGLRDININAAITATRGNFVACCGRDVNVNAPITTTNGSILLNAGQDIKVFFAITTTDGNIALCAGRDIHIENKVTLTRGSTIPAEALGLPVGLKLIAGSSGKGPGTGGGTLIFAPLAPPITVTKAPVNIYYNPVSYSAPTDYLTKFVLTEGATVTQRMLVFPKGDKPFDGTTNTTLNGFNSTATSGLPSGVSLVAGPNATATFDSSGTGSGIGITYTGYSLTGADADKYALAGPCCTSGNRTTGTITTAAAPPPPPATTPPPPPVTTPPPATTPPPTTPPPTTYPGTPLGALPTSGTTQRMTPWAPAVSGPTNVGLTVIDHGINLPAEQLAENRPAPVEVRRAAPQAVVATPSRQQQVIEAHKPIYHRRKQARN